MAEPNDFDQAARLLAKSDPVEVLAWVLDLPAVGRTSLDFEWLPTGPRTCLRVMERNVGRESAARTLAAVAGGTVGGMVLPLVPLMEGGGEPGIIGEWVRLAGAEPDPRRSSIYGILARVFSSRGEHAGEWQVALKEWNVTRSPVGEEWRTEGRGGGPARPGGSAPGG